MDVNISKIFFRNCLSKSKVKYWALPILISVGISHPILKFPINFFIKVYNRTFTIVPNLSIPRFVLCKLRKRK